MKKGLFIVAALLGLTLGLTLNVYGQHESELKIVTAEVVTVHPGSTPGVAYTMTVKTKDWKGGKEESVTIDPRCTFYKDDKWPKTIKIVRPGDKIEITYLVSEGIKVAFNIVVLPEP